MELIGEIIIIVINCVSKYTPLMFQYSGLFQSKISNILQPFDQHIDCWALYGYYEFLKYHSKCLSNTLHSNYALCDWTVYSKSNQI